VGLTTIDIVFAFDRYPEEDTKNTARQYTIAAGGPASNAAVVYSYLGGEAQLISSLGRRGISDIARSDLVRHRVRHIDITDTHDCEPALSVIANAQNNGSRTIFTSPAIDDEFAGPFGKNQVSGYMTEIDILLLDGHQAKLATHIAHQAREAGVPVVLDGDLYRSSTEDLLPLVDIVIFGKSFAIPRGLSKRDRFEYFESFGISHIIATNGAEPIEFLCDGLLGSIEVEDVPVLDTLGAGDFFHGAFCYSFSKDRDIQRALRFAARVASKSVTTFGTRNWMEECDPSDFE
jgi:sugar/nucleoside kinase (ribokinase family)